MQWLSKTVFFSNLIMENTILWQCHRGCKKKLLSLLVILLDALDIDTMEEFNVTKLCQD